MSKDGVHRTHCCALHGCKYGKNDCPVETALVIQEFPCDYCQDFAEDLWDLEEQIGEFKKFLVKHRKEPGFSNLMGFLLNE